MRMRRPLLGALTLALTAAPLAAESASSLEVRALDDRGRVVEPGRSHASFSRTLPPELGALPGPDHDALELLLIAEPASLPDSVEVLTRSAQGQLLDAIPRLPAQPAACPEGTPSQRVCARTAAIRLVPDALDRSHPAAHARSIRGELGGTLTIARLGRQLLQLRVGGPRETRLGPIERLRAKLRVFVLRSGPGGAPAVGGDSAGAAHVMARELASAAALWGQCGVELTAPRIQVVSPPRARLLTLGCELGQVASGGEIALRSGGARVRLTTRPGEAPVSVALRLAEALERAGRPARVFENQRRAQESVPTADLLLGADATFEPLGGPLSSDPSLPVCLGQVDLSDGLTHFRDGDAFAGTVEERALLRAFDDGDPSTIEVLVVPSFAESERIGESFIQAPGGSLSSTVIIDRWAIRTGARSFALAHELGHVLLAMPGHPDDFGVDQSWSLMDADVADATIFGPRRLSVADCERMLTQSGPTGPTPLLTPLPLR